MPDYRYVTMRRSYKIRDLRQGYRCGFTLVEVLCVVIVLGIIAAIVAPTLAPQDDLTVSAVARVLIADMQYAQRQAIASGVSTYVRFTLADENGNGGSYALYADAGLTQPITNPITGKSYTQTFGSGAQSPLTNVVVTGLNLNGSNNTVLVFDSLGTPSVCPMSNTVAPTVMSAPGSITLGCGTMSVSVSILPDTGDITASSVQSQ